MKELISRLNPTRYPPSSGVGGDGQMQKAGARQDVFSVSYDTRPPDALDFIVDNVLSGGGLPPFSVESDLLQYVVPPGYIAVVTGLEWYITPQNAAIDPAQLSMKLYISGTLLQGTDTMGIGQSGELDDLYIVLPAGSDITVKLGRGPGVVRYQLLSMSALRANGDPNGYTAAQEGSTNRDENLIASLNGVLFFTDGVSVWRSYNGIDFTNVATPGFSAIGIRWFFTFKNYLCYSDSNAFYYSINGVVWTLSNAALPDANFIGNFFEFNGSIYGWDWATQTLQKSSDLGVSWTSITPLGLNATTSTYKFVAMNGVLYAVRSVSTGSTDMFVYSSTDAVTWTLIKQAATIDGVIAFGGRFGFALSTFNNQLFLVGGTGILSGQMFFSNEGINWTQLVSANLPIGQGSATVSSSLGFVTRAWRDSAGVNPNNALYGVGLFPAIYDPELRCYCQIKGQLLKAKGTVQQTILNPV